MHSFMVKMRLSIELVPRTSWFDNVRAIVTPKQWDNLRSQVYSKAYHTCEICGGIGPQHPVECHEIWTFDNKTLIQKLEGMISLCPDCHMVKHIGLAGVRGKYPQALHHLMTVNKMTFKKAQTYVEDSFKIWEERSKKNWTVDISHLSDYGIDITKLGKK